MARGGNYIMRDVAVNAPETSTHKRGLLRGLIFLRGGFQNSRVSLDATRKTHAAWSRPSTMKPIRS